jgi:hypothetical protein
MNEEMLTKCPKCGSKHIRWSVETGFESDSAWTLQLCKDCDEIWYEIYPFSHCEDKYGAKIKETSNEI